MPRASAFNRHAAIFPGCSHRCARAWCQYRHGPSVAVPAAVRRIAYRDGKGKAGPGVTVSVQRRNHPSDRGGFIMNTFVEQLRHAMNSGGSQAEVARHCGLSPSTVSRFLAGKGGLSLEAADKL